MRIQRYFFRHFLYIRLSFSSAYLRLCVFALIFTPSVIAQRVAILTPDKAESSRSFAEKIEIKLGEKMRVLDDSLAESAYLSVSPATPFNLTTEESKKIGTAIGCDLFILLRSETLRRSSFERAEYYESYSAIYVVSSRTGRLVFWKLQQFEAAKPDKSEKLLTESAAPLASQISDQIQNAIKREITEPAPAAMEDVPQENSPAAKNFRAPIPYRRIKPEYAALASLYRIAASVELMVDLDANGNILRTDVVRWAGFGLDESVEKTVRSMNWRPAERNGKTLPMRFLVRYNFKKIEKD